MQKNFILSFLLLLFAAQAVFAVSASPDTLSYQLPDGSQITIKTCGDERVHWTVTPDGYTLLLNGGGFFEYAVLDPSGNLTLSGIHARNTLERTADERAFLTEIPKNLKYSPSQIKTLSELRYKADESIQRKALSESPIKNVSGTVHIPVMLVGFNGKPFTTPKVEFELLLNQLNYTANNQIPGSLRDYYLANSYEQLDLQFDLYGPYTLPNAISFYSEGCGGDPRLMAAAAVELADQDGADFSKYVLPGSNEVHTVHIIFAGYGAESAGGDECKNIWSHAWWLSQPIRYDNVFIYNYSCTPELSGSSGSNITTIGVIAHELGHSLCGLPDFYDTDYGSNGEAVHLWKFDLMASGNWNDNGRTPAYFSAYGRDFCGWAQTTTLTLGADLTLPHPADSCIIYRINTSTPNEYFLIENRQQQDWDKFIPARGMVIYHVDKNLQGWNGNRINSNSKRRGYYIKQAGCGDILGCDDEIAGYSRANDAYPIADNTAFTDHSTPDSKSWAGENTDKPITNITRNPDQTISFRFMNGDPAVNDAALTGIPLPPVRFGAGTVDVLVNLQNVGLAIESATIEWSVDGIAQTPYTWSGSLDYGSSTTLPIGSVNLDIGEHAIVANVVLEGDTNTANDTVKAVIRVSELFFTEYWEEDSGNWKYINGDEDNKWIVGTRATTAGTKSAYVSKNNSAYEYNLNGESIVHLYHDIAFPVSADSFDMYFDIRCIGEWTGPTGYDYMEARIVEPTTTPSAGKELSVGTSLGKYFNIVEWQRIHKTLPPSYSGTTKRLVFSWINDDGMGKQPPAAIDTILIASRTGIKTGIDNPHAAEPSKSSIQAWIEGGTLHIRGLTIGKAWRIYSILGLPVHEGVATAETVTLSVTSLPGHGIYIIHSENKSAKILY